MANLSLINGEFTSAEQHCELCVSIARSIGLDAMAGQQYAVLGLVEIAQGRLDDGRAHLATALEAARIEGSLLDAAVLLAHVAVLAAAEGRTGDAARLRAVADEAMSGLELAHWPMLEDARSAAMGGRRIEGDAVDAAAVGRADPWEELARELSSQQ